MGLSRQEYWSGLPFPSPRDLPNPGIDPCIGRRVLYHWATWEALGDFSHQQISNCPSSGPVILDVQIWVTNQIFNSYWKWKEESVFLLHHPKVFSHIYSFLEEKLTCNCWGYCSILFTVSIFNDDKSLDPDWKSSINFNSNWICMYLIPNQGGWILFSFRSILRYPRNHFPQRHHLVRLKQLLWMVALYQILC